MIRFRCQKCGAVAKLEDQLAGKRFICPGCDEVSVVANLIAADSLPPRGASLPPPLPSFSMPSRRRWIVAAVAGGVGLLLLGILLHFALRKSGAPGEKVWTHQEFQREFLGRTPEQVRARLGAPNNTEVGESGPFWYYEGITLDPATGKPDWFVELIFAHGTLATIHFSPPRQGRK